MRVGILQNIYIGTYILVRGIFVVIITAATPADHDSHASSREETGTKPRQTVRKGRRRDTRNYRFIRTKFHTTRETEVRPSVTHAKSHKRVTFCSLRDQSACSATL